MIGFINILGQAPPWTPNLLGHSTTWSSSLLDNSQPLDDLCYWVLNRPGQLPQFGYLAKSILHHKLVWSMIVTHADIITHSSTDITTLNLTYIITQT